MKINVIITGATGMVGEGVLLECLQHGDVEKILIINRKPAGYSHPKLTEIIHEDFYNLSSLKDRLTGYNACFFCLGVSSIGMNEKDYFRVTHDLTLHVASTLLEVNPDMTFCYVSGSGTDSTASGRSMWARVKGQTENDVMQLGFKNAYAFRPGFMKPTSGAKNALSFYKYIDWMFPLLRKAFPKHVCTLKEVGIAMIRVVSLQPVRHVLEVEDIVKIAQS
jgi:uncharacterized protein YbjT (DUF2867 family)